MAYPPQQSPSTPAQPDALVAPPQDPGNGNLPMSADQVSEWWARIELDRNRRKKESVEWKKRLDAYLPPVSGGTTDNVNSNIHFRNTELKIAETWAQQPELILSPLEPLTPPPDPRTGQPMPDADVVAVKRAILKKQLGPDGADADAMMHASLFDIYQTSGVAGTKICYECDITQQPAPQQPGMPPPDPGATVPVCVYERWRWYHFSPEKLIIPHDFHSIEYDEADYLGMEFVERDTPQTREAYKLGPDYQPTVSRDEMILSRTKDETGSATIGLIKGVELFIRAKAFDPAVVHSQLFRRLVLIEGVTDRPAIYVENPYQTLGPDGRFTPDSMIGNPIHPIVMRGAGDTQWVPADSAFTDPLVRNENTWMAQDIQRRDSNLPRFFHSDKISIPVDNLGKMTTGQGVAVPHALMQQGIDKLIAPIPHLESAQSDAVGREHLQRAMTETLGIGSNQAGSYSSTIRSATENAIVQQNVNVRMKGEQARLLKRYLQGVRKFDAILQRYMTDQDYIEIVGQDGQRRLVQYNQAHISGRYAYDAHTDTQLTQDRDAQFKRYTEFVNFLAKSGWLNMGGVVQIGADLCGYDSTRLIKAPQPPPPQPPPPVGINIAIKAADLGIPEVQLLLKERGLDLTQQGPSPQLQAEMAREAAKHQPHGGAADKMDLVDKHTSEHTGNQAGVQPQGAAPVPPVTPVNLVQ